MNPDRTPENPNIMLWHRQPWLIDHGAALSFHYDLDALTEETPRSASFDMKRHLFAETSRTPRHRGREQCPRSCPGIR